MSASERMMIRQACACWVSEVSYAKSDIKSPDTAHARAIALYWRCRAVVAHDRVIRLIDGQPVREVTP
jgi:hypothetical protein